MSNFRHDAVYPWDMGEVIRWTRPDLRVYDLYNSTVQDKSMGPLGCCFLLPETIFSQRAEEELTEPAGVQLIHTLLRSYQLPQGATSPTFCLSRIPGHLLEFLVAIYTDDRHSIFETRETTKKIVDYLWELPREISLEEEFFIRNRG